MKINFQILNKQKKAKFFDIGNNNFIKIEREKAVFRVVKEGDNYTLTQYYR